MFRLGFGFEQLDDQPFDLGVCRPPQGNPKQLSRKILWRFLGGRV